MSKHLNKFALFLLVFISSACSQDMWERGQPAGTDVLLQRSQLRLEEALDQNAADRSNIAHSAQGIEQKLLQAIEEFDNTQVMQESLYAIRQDWISLEGKLSPGNRPPYGELSGQLRQIITLNESGNNPSKDAFTLLAARMLNFLASEIEIPSQLLKLQG